MAFLPPADLERIVEAASRPARCETLGRPSWTAEQAVPGVEQGLRPLRGVALRAWLAIGIGLLCACEDERGGHACVRDADCSGRCVATGLTGLDDLQPANLQCGPGVGDGAPGAACQAATDCEHGLCAIGGGCLAPCDVDPDCEASERCQRLFVRGQPPRLHPVRACVPWSGLPDDAVVTASDVADALQASQDAAEGAIALPAAETPTLFAVRHLQAPRFPASGLCQPPLCVRTLRSMLDGQLLFDRDALRGGAPDAPLNPVSRARTVDPALIYIGNGSTPVWSDLGFEIELQSEVPGDVQLLTVRRVPSGGRLDLNIFYVGEDGWLPEGDRGPEPLVTALERVDDILGQAGIFVGEVRQLAVGGELVARGDAFEMPLQPGAGFGTLATRFGTWPELPALLRLSAGAVGPGVNLFLVRRIAATGASGNVVAVSGGTPGAMGMQGTAASGIAIATEGVTDGRALGRTIAHELGHFLGLFHTSEADGSVWEPLSDTPECRAERDADGDGVLSAAECQNAGADNLMFWAKTDAVRLTDEQRRILAQAPLLQ